MALQAAQARVPLAHSRILHLVQVCIYNRLAVELDGDLRPLGDDRHSQWHANSVDYNDSVSSPIARQSLWI